MRSAYVGDFEWRTEDPTQAPGGLDRRAARVKALTGQKGSSSSMAEDRFDLEAFRRRLYSPDALQQYRDLGYLDDPTSKDFPRFKTRFAPTASGPLHAGSALCLLMNYIWAALSGTKVLLRFETHEMCDWCVPLREDKQFQACREAVLRDIEWLGLAGRVEETEPLRLSPAKGNDRIYDWLTGYSAQPGLDVIAQEIARLDDDRRLGVNMLVRGWDLYGASYLYFALARRLYGEAPFFTFVPVLCDPSGQKLCKSTGAPDVRDTGLSRDELVGRLYSILVPSDPRERLSPEEAVEAFALSWRKDRRLTPEVMARLGLRAGPPAWKPIRPPSFASDLGCATSVVWDPDFVKRAGRT